MNIDKLAQILESGSKSELDSYCQDNDLEIKDGKIHPKNKQKIQAEFAFWDKRQLVKKINLNS